MRTSARCQPRPHPRRAPGLIGSDRQRGRNPAQHSDTDRKGAYRESPSSLHTQRLFTISACGAQPPDNNGTDSAGTDATATTDPIPSTATSSATASDAPVGAVPTLTSFDCDAAQSDAERIVCEAPELAALDRRLAQVFVDAQKVAGADTAQLTSTQRGWIMERNACWSADDNRRCMIESYKTRLVQLQINSGRIHL